MFSVAGIIERGKVRFKTTRHWKWRDLEVFIAVIEVSLKYERPEPVRSPVRDNLTIPFQDIFLPPKLY